MGKLKPVSFRNLSKGGELGSELAGSRLLSLEIKPCGFAPHCKSEQRIYGLAEALFSEHPRVLKPALCS